MRLWEQAPDMICKENYKTIYKGLFTLCSYLKTKESYDRWVTRRVWGFRHQISKAKNLKMSIAHIENLQENTANHTPFEALDCWLPELWWYIVRINWTSESTPKVAAMTVIKNMLHGIFSLLFLLAIRIYSWQMTSKICPRFLITLLSLDLLWWSNY